MLFHICKLPPCLSFQQNCLLLLRQPIKRSCVVGVPNCFLPKGYVTRFSSTFTYNLSHQQLTKKRLLIEKLSSSSILRRLMHSTRSNQDIKKTSTLMYMSAVGVLVIGLTFAAVPMYRIFCQSTGYGGEIVKDKDGDHIASLEIIKHRPIKIHFNADVSARMQWKFKPQQNEVIVMPGETALAFYTATNPTDEPVIGISTYNVIPFEAGKYFNKIQCFCFEEQQLNPHEQVDMPVFFYIDPEFAKDPKMENVKEITLSYTFFEAKEGMRLPFAQLNKM